MSIPDSAYGDDFPGEIQLGQDHTGRYVLVFGGPGTSVRGTAVSYSPAAVTAIAETYLALRRDEKAGEAA